MALGNGVKDVVDLLQKTTLKQLNVVSLPDKGRKLNTAEDAADIIKAIKENEYVEAFTLEGNTLGVEAAKAIAEALSKRPEFERALWSDMFTGRLRSEIPKALESLGDAVITAGARLTELDLCDNAFGPDGVKSVTKLLKSESCFTLRVLKFNNNGLGIGGGEILSEALLQCHKASVEAQRPLKLKVFVAGRNRLENKGAAALAKAFTAIGSLEEISMPQNGICHQGVGALAKSFKANKGLKIVNLNDNTFTAKAAISMSKILPSLQNLEVINFGDCLVKSKGAKAIADALKNSHYNLKQLILGFDDINKEAAMQVVEAMENKPHLAKLDLNGNCIGEDGMEGLRSKMSELHHEDVLGSMSDDEGEEDDEDEAEDDSEAEDESEAEDDEEKEEVSDEKEKTEKENGLKIAEEFLSCPSLESFKILPNPNRIELVKLALKTKITDVSAICRCFVQVSSVLSKSDDFIPCTDAILREAFLICEKPEVVINSLLIQLGLLKSEEKIKLATNDITGALLALDQAARQDYFPKDLAFYFIAFLSKPNSTIECSASSRTNLVQTLQQL